MTMLDMTFPGFTEMGRKLVDKAALLDHIKKNGRQFLFQDGDGRVWRVSADGARVQTVEGGLVT